MKNWQKTRNYRRMKDENGNVIANVITVFGKKSSINRTLRTMQSMAYNNNVFICIISMVSYPPS